MIEFNSGQRKNDIDFFIIKTREFQSNQIIHCFLKNNRY